MLFITFLYSLVSKCWKNLISLMICLCLITCSIILKPIESQAGNKKLKLNGIVNQELFKLIYNEEFIQLSRPSSGYDYLPYLMFSGLIAGHSDLCRSSLSPSAVQVDIYNTRYVGTDYSPFLQTDYYEKYISKTVYMEPKYEAAYRLSVLNSLKKIYESWKQEPGDLNILEYYVYISTQAIELALDSRKLISNNGCGSQVVLRFIDNLHNFVTGNWSTKTKDGYKYAEEETGVAVKRYYANVPASFSPEFQIPGNEKELQFIKNQGRQMQGLKWVVIRQFMPWHLYTNGIKSPPQFVSDAAKNNLDADIEKKYYVCECTYNVGIGQVTVNYWNAKGQLPPDSVQDFLKNIIREPRNKCPETYPGNTTEPVKTPKQVRNNQMQISSNTVKSDLEKLIKSYKTNRTQTKKETTHKLRKDKIYAKKDSRFCHTNSCREISGMNYDSLIKFNSMEEAREDGGIPCKLCKPSSRGMGSYSEK